MMSTTAAPLRLTDESLFRQQAYIDGAWCGADAGGTLPVLDPASGAVIGTVPDMGAAETRLMACLPRLEAAGDAAWFQGEPYREKMRHDMSRLLAKLAEEHSIQRRAAAPDQSLTLDPCPRLRAAR